MNNLRFTIEEKEIVLRECEVKKQLELYDEIISLINFVEKISKNIMWNNSDLILKIFFLDSNNNPIPMFSFTLDIDGFIMNSITDIYGYAILSFRMIQAGSLRLILSAEESEFYLEFEESNIISVEKCDTQFEIDNNPIDISVLGKPNFNPQLVT